MIMVDVYVNQKKIRFVNVYAPVQRSDTNGFFKDLHPLLLEPLPHVLVGDFNCVVDSRRDRRGPGQCGSTYQAKELIKVLRNLNLADAWVHKTTASRIDRIYLPEFLVPPLETCTVIKLPNHLEGRTDHLPVAVTIRGSPGPRPRNSNWRLDPALLEDEASVEKLQEQIRQSMQNVSVVNPDEWDRLKSTWKALLQEEGRARQRRYTAEMNEVLRRMQIVKRADLLTSCTSDYLETLRAKHDRLLLKKVRRPARSTDSVTHITEDINAVNGNGTRRITEVKRSDGSISTDPAEIEVIFRSHFKQQFERACTSDDDFSADRIKELCQHLQRPEEEDVTGVCDDVTMEELYSAIRNTIGSIPTVSVVKVLGVYFSCAGVAATTWQKSLERANQAVERLQQLDLTLREKALAVKTTVCAFANYASRAAVIPRKTANQLNKLINALLWDVPAPTASVLTGIRDQRRNPPLPFTRRYATPRECSTRKLLPAISIKTRRHA
ncbi:hypothetical protein HPB50_001665 [Hyalomma asiaticum]|uniref:Uncharacterized protein n=1 Tax=Hyalomma asiaticum TaxID=266040 RepID=A0ACB7SFJ4_HYAAI|nr:hypothetical protein HPB50_001665 [Hyalomma asiaticum]